MHARERGSRERSTKETHKRGTFMRCTSVSINGNDCYSSMLAPKCSSHLGPAQLNLYEPASSNRNVAYGRKRKEAEESERTLSLPAGNLSLRD